MVREWGVGSGEWGIGMVDSKKVKKILCFTIQDYYFYEINII
jgi:hypothetical protein